MATNAYLDYRNRASKDNLILRNRANAAELLGISESSLSNYETGKTKCVPPEMVAQMSRLYNAPELRNMYCLSVCPIGCTLRLATSESTIEQVAVHLLKSLDSNVLSVHLYEILSIAWDGVVDERKIEKLSGIAEAFDQITYAVSEFRILTERKGVQWN